MNREDVTLLSQGTKVLIANRLRGGELYQIDDPYEDLEKYLGTVMIVDSIDDRNPNKMIFVNVLTEDGNDSATFLIEEIEGICQDKELEESDIPIEAFLGLEV